VHQNQEFAIRARVLPALDVLRSATLVNAAILRREGELGVVTPGAFADLLLVDGDPLADVALLAEPEKHLALVMKGGEIALDRLG
jgi:imidazolonepropionase-like amidohydrolase